MYQIKVVEKNDLSALHHLIGQLAEYEKLTTEMVATPEDLGAALFGPNPLAQALIAFNSSHNPVGFALTCFQYSTFSGKPVLWIEDVYIEPEHRGKGLGKELWLSIIEMAKSKNCAKVEFRVLDWNQPAIDFYKKQGAMALEDWTIYRLAL